MSIPRYKTPITIPRADSEVSDGTTPVHADSEARADRFSQKRNFFTDRADKLLYFPILTLGREIRMLHADSSRGASKFTIR